MFAVLEDNPDALAQDIAWREEEARVRILLEMRVREIEAERLGKQPARPVRIPREMAFAYEI